TRPPSRSRPEAHRMSCGWGCLTPSCAPAPMMHMAQVKGPQAPLTGNVAAAARAAREGIKPAQDARAPTSPATLKAPSPPAVKAGGDEKIARPKTSDLGEVEANASDSFTSDTSALNDLRKMLGAIDENTSQQGKVKADLDAFDPHLSAVEVENLGN